MVGYSLAGCLTTPTQRLLANCNGIWKKRQCAIGSELPEFSSFFLFLWILSKGKYALAVNPIL